MGKYVIYIKSDESKVIPKELVTHIFTKEMRKEGFRKYHIVFEAESEKDAIDKLNKYGEGNLNALADFSGSIFFYCAISVLLIVVLVIKFAFLPE